MIQQTSNCKSHRPLTDTQDPHVILLLPHLILSSFSLSLHTRTRHDLPVWQLCPAGTTPSDRALDAMELWSAARPIRSGSSGSMGRLMSTSFTNTPWWGTTVHCWHGSTVCSSTTAVWWFDETTRPHGRRAHPTSPLHLSYSAARHPPQCRHTALLPRRSSPPRRLGLLPATSVSSMWHRRSSAPARRDAGGLRRSRHFAAAWHSPRHNQGGGAWRGGERGGGGHGRQGTGEMASRRRSLPLAGGAMDMARWIARKIASLLDGTFWRFFQISASQISLERLLELLLESFPRPLFHRATTLPRCFPNPLRHRLYIYIHDEFFK
jgi:hypothetical protein